MAVVMVAADLPETRREIAQLVAQRLGYRIVDPEGTVTLAKSRGLSEEGLLRALDPRPKLLDRDLSALLLTSPSPAPDR